MEFMKHKFIFLLLVLSSFQLMAIGFNAKECLDAQFEASTTGKGSLFGLLKQDLNIDKKDCVLTIKDKKYFFIETTWKVDICREPIHLKVEKYKNTSVFKKERKCTQDSSGEFCQKTEELLNIIRDIGLIFAQGNRQSLDSAHGKTYCTYLLLKEYLNSDSVFVSNQEQVYIDGLESNASIGNGVMLDIGNIEKEVEENPAFNETPESSGQMDDTSVEPTGSF